MNNTPKTFLTNNTFYLLINLVLFFFFSFLIKKQYNTHKLLLSEYEQLNIKAENISNDTKWKIEHNKKIIESWELLHEKTSDKYCTSLVKQLGLIFQTSTNLSELKTKLPPLYEQYSYLNEFNVKEKFQAILEEWWNSLSNERKDIVSKNMLELYNQDSLSSSGFSFISGLCYILVPDLIIREQHSFMRDSLVDYQRILDYENIDLNFSDTVQSVQNLNLSDTISQTKLLNLDIVFVVDGTTGNTPYIQLLPQILYIIKDNITKPIKLNIGLVAFRDYIERQEEMEYVVRHCLPLTNNLNEFEDAVNDLDEPNVSTEEYPEALFDGVFAGITESNWSESPSMRLLVLIGDASSHTEEANKNPMRYSIKQLQEEASIFKVRILSIKLVSYTSDDIVHRDQMMALAEGFGIADQGYYVEIDDFDNFSPIVMDLLQTEISRAERLSTIITDPFINLN
ncbi:MAG TPA: hypothetical protein DCE41_01275 [Cytophagales bacterium]|nr:hypothetical protein [Cytophagales bacterium]